jgi:hypothetical protein
MENRHVHREFGEMHFFVQFQYCHQELKNAKYELCHVASRQRLFNVHDDCDEYKYITTE